jgi:hypothetical protein
MSFLDVQSLVAGCGGRIATQLAVKMGCKCVPDAWRVLSSLLLKYNMQQLSMSYAQRIRT